MYVTPGTITSSLRPISRDFSASTRASVPEAQPTENLLFDILENSFSKSYNSSPNIKFFFFMTLSIFEFIFCPDYVLQACYSIMRPIVSCMGVVLLVSFYIIALVTR